MPEEFCDNSCWPAAAVQLVAPLRSTWTTPASPAAPRSSAGTPTTRSSPNAASRSPAARAAPKPSPASGASLMPVEFCDQSCWPVEARPS